jgi:hypothetical protein
MTTTEAIAAVEKLIDHVVCDTIAVRYTTPAKEALAVLRAVCEDYERARPLLDAVEKAALPGEGRRQHGYCFRWIADESEILEAALSCREAKETK